MSFIELELYLAVIQIIAYVVQLLCRFDPIRIQYGAFAACKIFLRAWREPTIAAACSSSRSDKRQYTAVIFLYFCFHHLSYGMFLTCTERNYIKQISQKLHKPIPELNNSGQHQIRKEKPIRSDKYRPLPLFNKFIYDCFQVLSLTILPDRIVE